MKRLPHKMIKYTQTIRRQLANELLESVWPFCGVGAWQVTNMKVPQYQYSIHLLEHNNDDRRKNNN